MESRQKKALVQNQEVMRAVRLLLSRKAMKRNTLVVLLSVLVGVAGCASLLPRVPAPPVPALTDVADTPLSRVATASLAPGDPSLSGFRLLPEGQTAFDARIALARRAQKSLDVQYYLIQDDDIGLQFLRELRDAARGGGRVRLPRTEN